MPEPKYSPALPYNRTIEEEFARKEEILECIDKGGYCGLTGMKPPHFASPDCESNGRRWDAENKKMIGHDHCTCDSCF